MILKFDRPPRCIWVDNLLLRIFRRVQKDCDAMERPKTFMDLVTYEGNRTVLTQFMLFSLGMCAMPILTFYACSKVLTEVFQYKYGDTSTYSAMGALAMVHCIMVLYVVKAYREEVGEYQRNISSVSADKDKEEDHLYEGTNAGESSHDKNSSVRSRGPTTQSGPAEEHDTGNTAPGAKEETGQRSDERIKSNKRVYHTCLTKKEAYALEQRQASSGWKFNIFGFLRKSVPTEEKPKRRRRQRKIPKRVQPSRTLPKLCHDLLSDDGLYEGVNELFTEKDGFQVFLEVLNSIAVHVVLLCATFNEIIHAFVARIIKHSVRGMHTVVQKCCLHLPSCPRGLCWTCGKPTSSTAKPQQGELMREWVKRSFVNPFASSFLGREDQMTRFLAAACKRQSFIEDNEAAYVHAAFPRGHLDPIHTPCYVGPVCIHTCATELEAAKMCSQSTRSPATQDNWVVLETSA